MTTSNGTQFLLPSINLGLSVPDKPPRVPSASVMKTLRKGDYVPLYHFTNRALSALNESTDLDLTLEDKSASLPSNIRKTDAELDLREFRDATERMLALLPYAGWPQEIIDMYRDFWANIQNHPTWEKRALGFVTHPNHKALLLYQDEQRRRWHLLCGSTPNSAVRYNLAIINDTVLQQATAVIQEQIQAAEIKEWAEAHSAKTYQEITQEIEQEFRSQTHYNHKRRRR
ncbi:hypothetical protein BDN70DRAFT_927390 [Pholiota conissans]|uniref:Uncharacterized protein n=1 Tax=Pholiota conissans TaxID=109636 RepID=A0A9P6D6C2_9AGAR|nr:hypothetical protein BDN70DRAFT_927390 [Pholiota conissans]